MTKKELVELSGISDELDEFDYTVPMNRDGSYPFNGDAITAYYKDRKVEVVSCAKLAKMAIARGYGSAELLRISNLKY